jgi:hypothetical protein
VQSLGALISAHFHHSRRKPVPTYHYLSISTLSPWQPLICFFSCWTCYYGLVISMESCCKWRLVAGSFHLPKWLQDPWYSVYISTTLLLTANDTHICSSIHPPVLIWTFPSGCDELYCYDFCTKFVWTYFQCSRPGIVGHMVTYDSLFEELPNCFQVALLYLSEGGFRFLQVLTHSYWLSFFLSFLPSSLWLS